MLVHENGGQDLWSYYCPFVKVTAHRGCVAPAEQTVMGLGVAGAIGAKLARPDADCRLCHGRRRVSDVPEGDPHGAAALRRPSSGSCSTTQACTGSSGSLARPASAISPSTSTSSPTWQPLPRRAGRTPSGSSRRASSTTHSCAPAERIARGASGGARVRDRHLGLPRRLHRVPPGRLGSRATGRRERNMSWIQTGRPSASSRTRSRRHFADCPRRVSRTSRSVPSKAFSSISTPTGSGPSRSTRPASCSTGSGCAASR